MTWLFSRALIQDFESSHSSPGLVEAFSAGTCSAGEPCAQLNVMPTQHKFWRNDKTMEPSQLSRFGLTCAVLTDDRGEALLTWFRAGFPVRTSASQERAQASAGSGRASGRTWLESWARFDPSSSSWRTPQFSLLEDSDRFLGTWPRSGLMRDGMCYLRPTLAPHISVSGFGSLLPTLTVCGNYNAKGASAQSGDGHATALKRMPTLVTRDYRHPGRSRLERTGGKQGEHLPNSVGGPLNPDWCEWFMGWPVGWTASRPLETDKFREWRQQHSPLLPTRSEATTETEVA